MTTRKTNAARYERLLKAFQQPITQDNELFACVDALTPGAFSDQSLAEVNQALVELQRQLLMEDSESDYLAHDPRLNLIIYKYLSAIPLASESISTFARKEIAGHVQRLLALYDHITAPINSHELEQTDINTQYRSLSLNVDDISPLLCNLLKHIVAQQDISDEDALVSNLAQLWLTMTYSPLMHNLGEIDATITVISTAFYPLSHGFDPACFTRAHAIDKSQVEFLKGIISYLSQVEHTKPVQQISETIRMSPLLNDDDKQQLLSHLCISCVSYDEVNKRLFNSVLMGMRFITKDLLSLILLIQNNEDISLQNKLDICNYLVAYARADLLARDKRSSSKQEVRSFERHLQQAVGVYKFYYLHNALSLSAEQCKTLLRQYRLQPNSHPFDKEQADVVMVLQQQLKQQAETLKLAIDAAVVNDELIDSTIDSLCQGLQTILPELQQVMNDIEQDSDERSDGDSLVAPIIDSLYSMLSNISNSEANQKALRELKALSAG